MKGGRFVTLRTVGVATAVAAVLAPAAHAAPTPEPYGNDDPGRFFHIIPPGEAGVDNGVDLLNYEASGALPAHFADQRDLYTNLLYATPGLKDADIGKYFPDATFGVKPEDVTRTESPRDDVTIVRDKLDRPHIYGSTRAGTEFGAGYVAAEDRLFMMDVLRQYGAGQLSSFAGGANVSTDEEQWAVAPYTQADLDQQVNAGLARFGALGQQVHDDAQAYVDGINAYIDAAKLNPSLMPAEYAAIGKPQGPDSWKLTDIISSAALIGAQLGNGGGNELGQVGLLQADEQKYGTKKGFAVWKDFRSTNDPEAPVTATRKQGFPYGQIPKRPLSGSVALPDPGTLQAVGIKVGGSRSASRTDNPATGPVKGLLKFPTSDSNALLVSAKNSASGHPLTVFGSQAAYFQPEIYLYEDLHGPGFEAAGASFPGLSLYVLLGRGRDYAWSATSAGQDIIDVYAMDLCNTDGSPATMDSTGYMFRGSCHAMEPLDRTISWLPNAADMTPPGSETMRVYRTQLGLVVAKAKIKGTPVVYTRLRSTYMHEIDSAGAFRSFNDPNAIHNVQDFQHAANQIGFTFNWFYTDDRDIGYFNSGANPIRPKGVNGLLPIRYSPKTEWKGFDPSDNLATYEPFATRPQAINQPFLTSWNNKQANHCCGGTGYTPLWRSMSLDDAIRSHLAGGHKMTLPQLVDSAEFAATVDLRGYKTLPWVLKVIGTPKDPQLAKTVAMLKAWAAKGAPRVDLNKDGTYDDAAAVRIMDALMNPGTNLLPKAVFEPTMGPDLFKLYDSELSPDIPNSFHGQTHAHLGSSWEDGWHGYLQKDLRTVLNRKKVRGRYSQVYCGGGKLKVCRSLLTEALAKAASMTDADLYNDPTVNAKACGNMDRQACFDSLRYRPLGAINQPLAPWQNRPTQQQVVEVMGHRPR